MTFTIPDFKSTKVVVVGDVMLDRYWHGTANRISPEAPVPVVHVQQLRECPGGAGNVALNLHELGVDVRLFGMIGDDAAGEAVQKQLQDAKIHTYLQKVKGIPTVTKLRVIGRNQQLIRLDFETGFHRVNPDQIVAEIEPHLLEADALIISDYGKGVLSYVHTLIDMATERQVPVLVDPKNRDFSVYRGATMLTPNLKELEAAMGPCHDEASIISKAEKVMRDDGIEAVLVTRGENGMSLVQGTSEPRHFKAHAREVYDVTGAGDTVIAVLGAALAARADLGNAVMLANTAAGIAVGRLGATTVTVPEIRRALQRYLESDVGMLTEQELLVAVSDARAHGESIVMTNGCFDILHSGHVHYLEQAKALGKRLVVAVNDDASCARLKGQGRPIVPLEQRMSVLSALRSVDWVVPFSEDTPARLIANVMPDVLVKGGDYHGTEIAGANKVKEAGGRVEILDFIEGCSSSEIIKKIQDLPVTS